MIPSTKMTYTSPPQSVAKELNNLLATLGVKVSDSKSHIDHLLSDNPWICDEKKFFDTAGSNYDFHAQGTL